MEKYKELIGKYFKGKRTVLEKAMFVIILILVSIVVIVSARNSMINNNYTKLQNEYDELSTNKKNKEDELSANIEDKEKQISEKDKKISELEKTEKQNEINNNIKTLESNISELSNKKQTLEKEIKDLQEDIIKIKGQSKSYPAGHLIVGTDVPAGKYKIYGGKSNFVVYSTQGRLQVNIILGGGRYGIDEYIYTFKAGEKIEASSSFKLIEVE